MNMLFIQLLGAIAFIVLAMSYFKKEKKHILYIQIIAYVFFTLHYLLLNGITGCICNIITLIALMTIYFFEKYNLKYKMIISIFFVILFLVINIIAFQNIYSIFPTIASIIAVTSFLNNDEDIIRVMGLISNTNWLIYAIVYKSYVSIIFESLTIIGIFIAFIKNSFKKNDIN